MHYCTSGQITLFTFFLYKSQAVDGVIILWLEFIEFPHSNCCGIFKISNILRLTLYFDQCFKYDMLIWLLIKKATFIIPHCKQNQKEYYYVYPINLVRLSPHAANDVKEFV